jgi:glycosyltransferase involved in cell wall biosynthesis
VAVTVVHLTSTHRPLDPRIFHKEARSLAAAGYRVVVIAPGDRDFEQDGVEVRSFPAVEGRLRRLLVHPVRVLRMARRTNASLFHFHDPELLWVGVVLRLTGRAVVYDAHEDLPRLVRGREWLPGWLSRPASSVVAVLERLAARTLSAVVAAEPEPARRFPTGRVAVVQNFVSVTELPSVALRPYEGRDPLVVYVGSISRHRGAVEMVAAMDRLPATLPGRLALGGTCAYPELVEELRTMPGSERVDQLGWLERDQVWDLMGRATVGVVLLHPIDKYTSGAQSVKLYEYMAAGLPVVASDFAVMRDVLGDDCGILVDPLDVDAVAEAIGWLLSHPAEAAAMGERGRQRVLERFTWEGQARRLVDLYGELLDVA